MTTVEALPRIALIEKFADASAPQPLRKHLRGNFLVEIFRWIFNLFSSKVPLDQWRKIKPTAAEISTTTEKIAKCTNIYALTAFAGLASAAEQRLDTERLAQQPDDMKDYKSMQRQVTALKNASMQAIDNNKSFNKYYENLKVVLDLNLPDISKKELELFKKAILENNVNDSHAGLIEKLLPNLREIQTVVTFWKNNSAGCELLLTGEQRDLLKFVAKAFTSPIPITTLNGSEQVLFLHAKAAVQAQFNQMNDFQAINGAFKAAREGHYHRDGISFTLNGESALFTEIEKTLQKNPLLFSIQTLATQLIAPAGVFALASAELSKFGLSDVDSFVFTETRNAIAITVQSNQIKFTATNISSFAIKDGDNKMTILPVKMKLVQNLILKQDGLHDMGTDHRIIN